MASSVIAFLGADLCRRLTGLVDSVELCATWHEVSDSAQSSIQPVLFADPSLGHDFAECVLAFKAAHPAATVVLYSHLHGEPIRRCLLLANSGITDVVFANYDDSRNRVRDLIDQIELRGHANPLLDELAPRLDGLPVALREAVVLMFSDPARVKSVADLARHAGMSKRALFRHLELAGIRSARILIASARVICAYKLLCDRGGSVGGVAMRLGYRSSDRLGQHFVALLGIPPRSAQRSLTFRDACSAIARAVEAPIVVRETASAYSESIS